MRLKQEEDNTNLKSQPFMSPYFSLSSFWIPDFFTLSAWIEHAPFAFWLVNIMRPKTLVELGTHTGYSYFAFCQAIQQLELHASCYAIDTWKGDEHSGFYDEEVFQNIYTYNSQKYSGFSQLLRSTFDEALEYFLDQSIDILHLDGRHFYEDVRHDFEAWLPKLSDRAVVLLHDINVKERHFGVFKFWEEIRQHYPHFGFIHGHGLGVLGVGENLPITLRTLFNMNYEERSSICYMYSRLGAAIDDHFQVSNQKDYAMLKAQLLTLAEENKKNETEAKRLKNQLEVLNNFATKEQEIRQLKNQLSITENALKERERMLEKLGAVMAQIYSSRFWRYTSPLRKLFRVSSC